MREIIDIEEGRDIFNISNKLKHKTECDVTNTRVRNRLIKEVALAYELLSTGKLYSLDEVIAIQTKEDLSRYVEQIKKKGIYVLDMETTGLDVFNDIVVGVCLYVEGLPSAYIPINHTDLDNNLVVGQLSEIYVRDSLREIFEDKNIKTVGHNFKYDYKVVLWNWGIKIANVYFDTMVGGFLLNENERHGLKPLHNKYVLKGEGSNDDFGDYFGNTPFNYIPIDVAKIYGANDGIKNWQLYLFQKKYLVESAKEDMKKLGKLFFEVEMPLTPVLADIELRGVSIREDYAKELSEEMRGELDIVIAKMDKEVEGVKEKVLKNETLNRLTNGTGKINYSSPTQLQAFLYDVLKLRSGHRKNPRGTGEEVLLLLKDKYKLDFIEYLLRYRGLKVLLNTFVDKIPRVLEPKTNAVHTQFNQCGAGTGRFSSSDPITKLNLQNIPSHEKRIRKIFRAREGYYFVGGDFSQIEPRTLACLSEDENMKKAYIDNLDLYSIMASSIFNLPVDECKEFRADGTLNPEGKERRTMVKSVLLGIMYSRGAKSIADQFGKPLKWAEGLIDDFFKAYPKVKELQTKVVYQAEQLGYVNTMYGRKRRLPDMRLKRTSWEYANAYRQCLNAVIQGTSADTMKLAMINLYNHPKYSELGIKMLITVHDELICEVPKEVVKEGKELIESVMKKTGYDLLQLPMKVDCEVTEVWYGENIEV